MFCDIICYEILGAMTGFVYKNAPQNVFHSWVEVYFEDKWYELEAFILDKNI